MRKVLVACEYSGRVRNAFAARGWDALSCDLLPSETPGHHYQGDVFDVIDLNWDLLICHPPCTDLAVSGARHFAAKIADGRQQASLAFVQRLLDADIKYIALENPVSIISTRIRKPNQASSPGSLGTAKRRPLACGSRTCQSWCRQTSSMDASLLCITCHLDLTGGRTAAGRTPALRKPSRINGVHLSKRISHEKA